MTSLNKSITYKMFFLALYFVPMDFSRVDKNNSLSHFKVNFNMYGKPKTDGYCE